MHRLGDDLRHGGAGGDGRRMSGKLVGTEWEPFLSLVFRPVGSRDKKVPTRQEVGHAK